MTTTADRLAPGESGYIESLLLSGARRSRLLDLGLTPGTLLTAGISSPRRISPSARRKAHQVRP